MQMRPMGSMSTQIEALHGIPDFVFGKLATLLGDCPDPELRTLRDAAELRGWPE